MEAKIISFESLRKRQNDTSVFKQWFQFYQDQPHENLLDALVYEHENNFPLRRSSELRDQLRHKALVEAVDQRAQTQLLKTFVKEIKESFDA